MNTYIITVEDADGKRALETVSGDYFSATDAFREHVGLSRYCALNAVIRLERDGRILAEFDKAKELNR